MCSLSQLPGEPQDLPGGERRTEFSESSSHRGYKLLVAQLFEPRPQVEVEAADAAFGGFFGIGIRWW